MQCILFSLFKLQASHVATRAVSTSAAQLLYLYDDFLHGNLSNTCMNHEKKMQHIFLIWLKIKICRYRFYTSRI